MQNDAQGVAWFNGVVTDFSSGRASIEDRGFMFADGVYEVIHVYGGKPFAISEHMARLQCSAAGIELDLPFPAQEIIAIAGDVLSQSGLSEAEIYIQVTRGAARRSHVFPRDARPSLLVGAR